MVAVVQEPGALMKPDALARLKLVPDGAISIESDGVNLVLRASSQIQNRFEQLQERRQAGLCTEEEKQEYQAIGDLDDALTWLNRLARTPKKA